MNVGSDITVFYGSRLLIGCYSGNKRDGHAKVPDVRRKDGSVSMLTFSPKPAVETVKCKVRSCP